MASWALILNQLPIARRPMTVGEIVDAVDVRQSTLSHHLTRLADTGFVRVKRCGNANRYRVKERCLEAFAFATAVWLSVGFAL